MHLHLPLTNKFLLGVASTQISQDFFHLNLTWVFEKSLNEEDKFFQDGIQTMQQTNASSYVGKAKRAGKGFFK